MTFTDRIRACYVQADCLVRQAVTDMDYEEDEATCLLLALIKERFATCLVDTGKDYSRVFHRDALDEVPDETLIAIAV
jgi:hypothetical protein